MQIEKTMAELVYTGPRRMGVFSLDCYSTLDKPQSFQIKVFRPNCGAFLGSPHYENCDVGKILLQLGLVVLPSPKKAFQLHGVTAATMRLSVPDLVDRLSSPPVLFRPLWLCACGWSYHPF